jgi:hypothetical protein
LTFRERQSLKELKCKVTKTKKVPVLLPGL